WCDACGGEAVGAGTLVQLGDQVPRGGEHDRVHPAGSVGGPSSEDVVRQRCEVTDVDTVVVEVEPERLEGPVPQGEGGGTFGGVGEPHELGQVQVAVGGADVAQDASGAERGELVVIADQTHRPAPDDDVLDDQVEGEGVG